MEEQLQEEPREAVAGESESDGEGGTPDGAADTNDDAASQDEGAAAGEQAPPAVMSGLYAAVLAQQEHSERNHDRLLRTTADFENYRRRARRDLTAAVQQAEQQIVLVFLPILDNLERAIGHAEDTGAQDESARNLLDGVKMVHKQFISSLAQHGIEPLESIGQIFDPEFHEALQQLESDEPRNTVLVEVQKGYLRNERLVRPAMVVVSKGPSTATASEQGEEEVPDTSAAEDGAEPTVTDEKA